MPMQTNRDFATLLKDLLAESENDGRGLAGPASVSFDYLAVADELALRPHHRGGRNRCGLLSRDGR
jgi:hypothetical protein